MSKLLLLGLLAMACGGESQAAFQEQRAQPLGGSSSHAAGAGNVAAGGVIAGQGGQLSSPAAGMSGSGEVDGGEPATGVAGGSSGAGSSMGGATAAAGAGGAAPDGGKGGVTHGGAGGVTGGAGKGGSSSGGSGGKPVEIPDLCRGCVSNPSGYCEISELWPAGACVQCPVHYLDCDGPAPEVYGELGAGCETRDTNQGSCP